MPLLKVIPGNLPTQASCGTETAGATVVNLAAAPGATVQYSSSPDVDQNPQGALAPGQSTTLYGSTWFWVPPLSVPGWVGITPLAPTTNVIAPGGGVTVVVTQEPTDGQFPDGTLIVLVDGQNNFVKMWVQT